MKNKTIFAILSSVVVGALVGTYLVHKSTEDKKNISGNLHIQKDSTNEIQGMYLEVLIPMEELIKKKKVNFKVYTETYIEDSNIKLPKA